VLRFRKDHLIQVGGVRVRPDIVFSRWKVAVFVDGCFWHRCPEHFHEPKRNLEYWVPKLAANVARDRRVDAALTAGGGPPFGSGSTSTWSRRRTPSSPFCASAGLSSHVLGDLEPTS